MKKNSIFSIFIAIAVFVAILGSVNAISAQQASNNASQLTATPKANSTQNETYQLVAPNNPLGVKVQVSEINQNSLQSTFAQAKAKANNMLTSSSANANGMSKAEAKPLVTASILDRDKGTTVVRSQDLNTIVNILQTTSQKETAAGHKVILVCPIHSTWVHFDLFID